MKILTAVFVLVAAPVFAQTSAPQATPPPQAAPSAQAPANPLSTYLKNAETSIQNNILKSAEKMSEADFAFKPQGTGEDVRTFGRLVGHLANSNYFFCSRVRDEQSPSKADIEKTITTRADLIKALTESFTYCDTAYTLTDTKAMELITVPGPNNTTRQITRAQVLIGNLAHNNEHYGNIVTYLRAKGLVPPSSER